MFVDVEPFFLYTGRDAEAMYDIESFKDHKSHSCRPASYHDGSEKLCQQEIPRNPQTPCTDEAPTGSSIFITWSIKSTAKIMTVPQIAPIRTAPTGDTRSQPAVMPTSPANTPLRVSDNDGFLYFIQATIREKNPPAQAARLVVRNTCEIARRLPSPAAASCDPGLKPNQPNQRIKTPRQAMVRL